MLPNTINAATPEGVLESIEDIVSSYSFEQEQLKQLSIKLLNFRTTSLWDTVTELLLFKTMAGNIPLERLKLEYPLGESRKGSPAKDADIALLGDDGEPMVLIDAVAPNMPSSINDVRETIINWIEKKYNSKFATYCQKNPNAKVSIFVSLIKAEMVYVGFPMKLADPSHIVQIQSPKLDALPGLLAGFACSFRSPDRRTLILDHVAKYERI